MELFKEDGSLKKRSALIAHYTDYVVGNAKRDWEEARKAEHKTLFPEMIPNPLYDALAEIPVAEMIDNPAYVEYAVWVKETVVVTKAKKAVVDANGMVTTPAVAEVTKLVREFTSPIVTDVMLDAYLAADPKYGKAYGDVYNGYRVPFKNEDAMGMLQVKAAFEMGLLSTNIHFSNGVIMPIAVADFPLFAKWFVDHRDGYFV